MIGQILTRAAAPWTTAESRNTPQGQVASPQTAARLTSTSSEIGAGRNGFIPAVTDTEKPRSAAFIILGPSQYAEPAESLAGQILEDAFRMLLGQTTARLGSSAAKITGSYNNLAPTIAEALPIHVVCVCSNPTRHHEATESLAC
jgi:hypothetical protein